MRRLIPFLLIFWASLALAEPCAQYGARGGSQGYSASSGGGGTCADPNCTGFITCQNFEGAGYDNGETWTETIGTNGIVDEDDTTAPVLRGSQQLKIYAGDAGQVSYAKRNLGADYATVYGHIKFRIAALPSSGSVFLQAYDSGLNALLTITLNNTSTVKITHGTSSKTTIGVMSANTIYHVWYRYTAGTGADGTYSVGFSETTTEPGAGNNNYASGADGSATASIRHVWLQARYQTTEYFDQVLMKQTSIGDVCD